MIIPARTTRTGKLVPEIVVDDNAPPEVTSRTWCDRGNGYPAARIAGKIVSLHRYVLFLRDRQWPAGDVDHINGNTWDARISNLRIVDRATNRRNRHAPLAVGKYAPNVYPRHERDRPRPYRVRFKVGGSAIQVGTFATIAEAEKVAARVREIMRENDTARHALPPPEPVQLRLFDPSRQAS